MLRGSRLFLLRFLLAQVGQDEVVQIAVQNSFGVVADLGAGVAHSPLAGQLINARHLGLNRLSLVEVLGLFGRKQAPELFVAMPART